MASIGSMIGLNVEGNWVMPMVSVRFAGALSAAAAGCATKSAISALRSRVCIGIVMRESWPKAIAAAIQKLQGRRQMSDQAPDPGRGAGGNPLAGLWPITDPVAAARASRHGFWAAVFNLGLTATVFGLALAGGNLHGRPLSQEMALVTGVELALFLPIAWGLWRHNPFAAAAAFVVYLASEALAWGWQGLRPDVFSLIVLACFTLFFADGIRGTLALARLSRG